MNIKYNIISQKRILANPKLLEQCEQLDLTYFPRPWKKGELAKFAVTRKEGLFIRGISDDLDRVIGFIFGVNDPFLQQFHLYKIMIHPDYRGKSLSLSLMKHAYDELERQGILNIYLEVEVDNNVAIRLYERVGLDKVHRVKSFYSDGKDAHIMTGVINHNLFD